MTTTRRGFLNSTLAAAALIAARGRAEALGATADVEKPAGDGKGLEILILGGTGFIGPALVELAKPRGHVLTLFNRGRTNPGLFPDVERLQGDRWPDRGEGIKALADRKWDVVFDDCGYYPRQVDASAKLLAPNVGHYVYVSSISCYAKTDVVGADETAELARLSDPTVETMGKNYENYGGLKVLCEEAAEKAMPGRTTIVRPGYIVGPGDPTDRFTYWPVRFARGGDVLVPGTPDDPLQVIDVRDLAQWMLAIAEKKTLGAFNACGPKSKLAWGTTLDACEKAAGKDSTLRWLSNDTLEKHQSEPAFQGLDFPIWAPATGATAGVHTTSNARAVAAGLTFLPIATTVADTLAWWNTLPAERREKPRAGLSPEKEAEILKLLG